MKTGNKFLIFWKLLNLPPVSKMDKATTPQEELQLFLCVQKLLKLKWANRPIQIVCTENPTSTHIISELGLDTVFVLDKGLYTAEGLPADIIKTYNGKNVIFSTLAQKAVRDFQTTPEPNKQIDLVRYHHRLIFLVLSQIGYRVILEHSAQLALVVGLVKSLEVHNLVNLDDCFSRAISRSHLK